MPKQGFGSYGLQKNYPHGHEGSGNKGGAKNANAPKLKGTRSGIPSFNHKRNKELKFGSRTNY